MIPIKSPVEIEKMREAGAVAAEILRRMCEFASVGISTYELDCFGRDVMMELGATSSAYHFPGPMSPYPAYSCISVNDEVVHGIPSEDRVLKDGDIVSIDVSVFYDGFVGDNTRTVIVGKTDKKISDFVERTKQALMEGVSQAVAGNHVGDISSAVERVAVKWHYGVLRDYGGHGVGREMHEEPFIPNYGKPGSGPLLKPGMVIAIEPMFTLGREKVFVADDGWTVKTVDGSFAAHWEHTVLITDGSPEILTLVKK